MADHGELEEHISQFTEDASWEYPGELRQGRSVILDGARQRRRQGLTGPGSQSRHVITTLAVQIDDPLTATADSYWMFLRNTTTEPTPTSVGYYHDTLRWVDGLWQIARREITLG